MQQGKALYGQRKIITQVYSLSLESWQKKGRRKKMQMLHMLAKDGYVALK